jgi:hypothetical protein
MVVDILTKGLSIPNIIYVHIVVIVGIEQYKNITFFFPSLPLAQSIIFSKKGIKPIHTLDLWYECVELGEKCVFFVSLFFHSSHGNVQQKGPWPWEDGLPQHEIFTFGFILYIVKY